MDEAPGGAASGVAAASAALENALNLPQQPASSSSPSGAGVGEKTPAEQPRSADEKSAAERTDASLAEVRAVTAHKTFIDVLSRYDAKMAAEPRTELLALNIALRRHGTPAMLFGAPPGSMPVGHVVLRRPELCVLGLHRHFLSEVSATVQGVESLLIGADAQSALIDDQGDRIYYLGCAGARPAQLMTLQSAFISNSDHQRPVRVLRTVNAATSSLALRAAGISSTAGGRRRDCFRYDGLYAVCRVAADAELLQSLGTSEAAQAAAANHQFLLVRLPGQPSLPPGVGGKPRRPTAAPGAARSTAGGDGTGDRGGKLGPSLLSEVVAVPAAVTLPQHAEEACVGAGVSVRDALDRLLAARDALLEQLSARDAYVLAKRSAINQARLRAAIALMVQAPILEGEGSGRVRARVGGGNVSSESASPPARAVPTAKRPRLCDA
jgi:hypothetical protein